MPDFRVADTAPEHRKLRAAGLAAVGLWAMAGAYAMRELTDGWVPDYWVNTWPSGKKQAAVLVKLGLWRRERRDGLDGYCFHDWDSYQRPAKKINEEREKARDRMAALRSSVNGKTPSVANVRANKPRTPDERADELPAHFDRTDRERSGEVQQKFGNSLSLTPGGQVGGETSGKQREATRNDAPKPSPTSENRPPDRCTQHRDVDGDPGPCRGCGKAREHAEQWDRDTQMTALMDQRRCPHCDADGWRYEPGTRIPMSPYKRCGHRQLRSVS